MPVEFHLAGAHLGFLDPGAADDDDLPARARVALPLWLGATLAGKRMVRPELPEGYQRKFREVLDAGASAVDLRAQCANYYVVGDALARLLRDEEDALRKKLRATFAGERFERVLDWSLNSHDEDVTELKLTLTDEERQLFEAGYASAAEMRRWKARAHTAWRGHARGAKRARVA